MFTTAFLDLPALDAAAGEVLLPGSKSISNRVLLLSALSLGTTTVYADYVSGSGSSALVFRYTVQANDLDTNGIAVGTLALNGGTLAGGGTITGNVGRKACK